MLKLIINKIEKDKVRKQYCQYHKNIKKISIFLIFVQIFLAHMINYLRNSIRRKIARRITKEYPTRTDKYEIEGFGEIKFANWENPLVTKKNITKKSIDFYRKFLKSGDFAIDIGSNIGKVTVQMSLITGKEGLILAFDPNPFVFEILNKNAELNPNVTNIDAYNFAISEKNEDFFYHSSEASFTNGGISKEKKSRHGKYQLSQPVKGVEPEKFLNEKYLTRLKNLKLIKIDTEGYDTVILKSLNKILDTYMPVVITECFGKNSDKEKFEQYQFLKNKGYSIFYFSDFSSDAEIIPIEKKEDMLKYGHFDFYAVNE